jgi:hypothetical protein
MARAPLPGCSTAPDRHRTIGTDGQALGYAHLTDVGSCAFCAMLASRGPVYKTAATAGGPRGRGVRYHDYFACLALPVFSHGEAWFEHATDHAKHRQRVPTGYPESTDLHLVKDTNNFTSTHYETCVVVRLAAFRSGESSFL